jgi:hypothetical protein
MMTFPGRMQAYVIKELGKGIIYLSPMLITERTIMGYDIPDTHAKLVNLNPEERKKYREDLLIEYKYRAGMYIYEAMKKVRGNRCMTAATSSSKSKRYLEHIYRCMHHDFSF